MASVADPQLDIAADHIMAVAGEFSTYTPYGGDPIEGVRVIPVSGVMVQPQGDAEVWAQGTTIDVLIAETGQEPGEGDTFETDSTTYTVKEMIENDGRWCRVQVR